MSVASAKVVAGERTRELAAGYRDAIYRRTDRMFAGLLVFQWLAAVALALWVSPLTWAGAVSRTHPHVWAAVAARGWRSSPAGRPGPGPARGGRAPGT